MSARLATRTPAATERRSACPMTSPVDPSPPKQACRRAGRSPSPAQVQQHHDLLGLHEPVGQQPSGGTKGDRPPDIAKAAPAKDHAGLGRIHPKNRDDASDVADQERRGITKLPADPVGNQDLVGRSRDLVPDHYLGAVTLADTLEQGPPLGKLLGRGCGQLGRHGRRLAHAYSILAIQPDPQPPAHNCAGAVGPRTPAAAKRSAYKKAFCMFRWTTHSPCWPINCRSTSACLIQAIVIDYAKLSACGRASFLPWTSARLRALAGS